MGAAGQDSSGSPGRGPGHLGYRLGVLCWGWDHGDASGEETGTGRRVGSEHGFNFFFRVFQGQPEHWPQYLNTCKGIWFYSSHEFNP